ncbi:ornithine cyclodeaminase (plasmid) [Burkholderia sp. SFA1]|nr:ornithine cyclodeaminase [Burkholderia sp. SFA1]
MLPFDELIEAIRDAFVVGGCVPQRHAHDVEGVRASGISLLMPAWGLGGHYGVKVVNIFPSNRDIGLPGLHSMYMLFDGDTGKPLAIFDGNEITSRRTAAASALAASFLAKDDSHDLLVVGSGRVGRLIAPAMAAVRPIERVQIWDIDIAAATQCVTELRRYGLDASVSADLEQSARGADIVSCATLSKVPLIKAAWLKPGSHLDLIGSFTPDMTEAEPACFEMADVWVDTEEALVKSGDLLNAIREGTFTESALGGTLFSLCRNETKGRVFRDQRTVFKAVGTGLEDLAAAVLAIKKCG